MNQVFVMFLAILLSGCATSYQTMGISGGFEESNIEGDVWRITFGGNGYATRETVQTYWLYRCSEVALANGFDGFEILSNIQLVKNSNPEDYLGTKSSFIKTGGGGVVYVPLYIDESNKPSIEADIQLLKLPFEARPPKVFDAHELKEVLEPIVNAEKKCDMGNVCPHVHKYLYPKGRFKESGI